MMIGTDDLARIWRHTRRRRCREHHVEQHQPRACGVEALQRVGTVDGDLDPEPLTLECDPQRVAVRLLVVDDEDQCASVIGRSPGHRGS